MLVSARVSYLKRWYITRSTPINREVSQSQTIWNLQLLIVTRALKNPASEGFIRREHRLLTLKTLNVLGK